jgi:hydroxyacylglutathione hydrolase
MKQLAEGVWQLSGALPFPNAINTYLVGDVLVDAGARFDTKKILRQLRGREVRAHALTHAHSDHQGASRTVCQTLDVPFWVGERDVPVAENPQLILERQPDHLINKAFFRLFAGPGHSVDRALKEGDEVAGFQVLDTPGHSAGHIALWRESDRVLILGDVLANMDTTTGIPSLREPKRYFTPDPATNRRSAKRLGPLEPALVLFGHGAPLRDTRKFVDFCAALDG